MVHYCVNVSFATVIVLMLLTAPPEISQIFGDTFQENFPSPIRPAGVPNSVRRAVMVTTSTGSLRTYADGVKMNNFLKDNDFHVTWIHDYRRSAVTGAAVLQALDSMSQQTKPGDTACFFYSGHGEPYKLTLEHAVIPRQQVIDTFLKSLPKGSLAIMILDCCYGGNIFRLPYELRAAQWGSSIVSEEFLPHNPTEATVITFAASDINQMAGDYESLDGGLITKFITSRSTYNTIQQIQDMDPRDSLIKHINKWGEGRYLAEHNFVFSSNSRELLENYNPKTIDLFDGTYIGGHCGKPQLSHDNPQRLRPTVCHSEESAPTPISQLHSQINVNVSPRPRKPRRYSCPPAQFSSPSRKPRRQSWSHTQFSSPRPRESVFD